MSLQPKLLLFVASISLNASAQAAQNKFGQVAVGSISINSLDRTSAARRLRRELAPRLERRVALTLGSKVVYRKRRDLGLSLDIGRMLARAEQGGKYVPLSFTVDRRKALTATRRLASRLSSPAQEARPLQLRGRFSIRPERVGRTLNPSTSAARLEIQAEKDASKVRFQMAGKLVTPQLTRARLKGVTGVLASFSTRFNPANIKRTRNMRVAIRSIDGSLLSPGETFSLNKTVGERTQARGYRTAIIFEDGQKKPGLGGGVSQVTGTLFNAALQAALPIVTYRTHSRPVTYLPLGRDATVAWGSFDMKFKNDTDHPVFISYKLQGSRATATLFGHRSGKKVSLRVISKRNNPRDISASLFRTVRKNGRVVKKERVGSSRYQWKADNAD